MGASLSSAAALPERMASMPELMAESQRAMAARQVEIQLAMRERQMAAQIAQARDAVRFYGAFVATAAVGLTAGAIKRRNVFMMAPLVPLGFMLAYQWDFAFNDKVQRVTAEAESILATERHLLSLPGGPLTIATIDARIAAHHAQAQAAAAAAGTGQAGKGGA